MKISPPKSTLIRKRVPEFKDWLRMHGCEIQEPSNDYELVRFKSALGVGVLYTGQKGISVNVPFVVDAVSFFLMNMHWQAGRIQPTKRSPSPKRKKELLARDEALCFYCNLPLNKDITEEHLVPVSQRGSNRLDNIVLAHFKCNQRAAHKSLVEKIKLRDQMRNKHE